MSKILKIFALALASMLTFSTLCFTSSCSNEDGATFFPTITIAQANGGEEYTPSINPNNSEEVEIPLLSGAIYDLCANYEICKSEGKNPDKTDIFAPTPIKITWTSNETPLYYEFHLSDSHEMTNPASYMVNTNSVTLENLFMGWDYYYQIYAQFENKMIKSRVFKFSTSYLPRTIFVDENVSNTRDWGGYYTEDGKYRVKQGIVYRGGKLEGASAQGKAFMLDALGIKTDLDVRGDGESTGTSPLGKSVNYIETKGPYYLGGTGIDFGDVVSSDRKAYLNALVTEIRAFANPDNFPIYVHCSLGRDRTGTICFLINALLGVGKMDLYRDYEISLMSKSGTGDNPTAAHMVGTAFGRMYNYVRNFRYTDSLAKSAEIYMLSLGITEEEIAAIKNNMLEKI